MSGGAADDLGRSTSPVAGSGPIAHPAREAGQVPGARLEHALDRHALRGQLGGRGAAARLRPVARGRTRSGGAGTRRVRAEGASARHQDDRAALHGAEIRVGVVLLDQHVVAQLARGELDLDAPRILVDERPGARRRRRETAAPSWRAPRDRRAARAPSRSAHRPTSCPRARPSRPCAGCVDPLAALERGLESAAFVVMHRRDALHDHLGAARRIDHADPVDVAAVLVAARVRHTATETRTPGTA